MAKNIKEDFNFKRLVSLLRELPEDRQRVLFDELEKESKLELLKVEDVAGMMKVTPFTVRKWLREGRIKGNRIGRAWFIPRDEFERLVKGE